jgi:hypothetical protein
LKALVGIIFTALPCLFKNGDTVNRLVLVKELIDLPSTLAGVWLGDNLCGNNRRDFL